MEIGAFYVSGYGIFYACAILMAGAMVYACDTLPQCVAPRLLTPHSAGYETVTAVAALLLFSGAFGIVVLMLPDSTEEISVRFAILGGFLSFVFTEKCK